MRGSSIRTPLRISVWADSSFVRDNLVNAVQLGKKNPDFTFTLFAPRNGICYRATISCEQSDADDSNSTDEQLEHQNNARIILRSTICVGGQIFSRQMDKIYSARTRRREIAVPKTVRELCDQVYLRQQIERIVLNDALRVININCCRSTLLKQIKIPQSVTQFFDWEVALSAPVTFELGKSDTQSNGKPTIQQFLRSIFTNDIYRSPLTEQDCLVMPDEIRGIPGQALCNYEKIKKVVFVQKNHKQTSVDQSVVYIPASVKSIGGLTLRTIESAVAFMNKIIRETTVHSSDTAPEITREQLTYYLLTRFPENLRNVSTQLLTMQIEIFARLDFSKNSGITVNSEFKQFQQNNSAQQMHIADIMKTIYGCVQAQTTNAKEDDKSTPEGEPGLIQNSLARSQSVCANVQ